MRQAGKTALDLAVERGHAAAALLLREVRGFRITFQSHPHNTVAPEPRQNFEALKLIHALNQTAEEKAARQHVAAEKEAAKKAAAEIAASERAERAAKKKAAAHKAAAEKKAAAARLAQPGRAGKVAAKAWTSLDKLVECVGVVHEGRDNGGNSAASVLGQVVNFAALRKELEAGAAHIAAPATVREACRAAEEKFRESRAAADVSQREVSPCSGIARGSGCPIVVL